MKRLIALDMLRGYALVCIMLDHMPVSTLRGYTLANFSIFDAAELFVLLSGFLVGLVWLGVERKEGRPVARWRFARRAFEVWRALVVGGIVMALLSAGLLEAGMKHTAIWNQYAEWVIDNPWGFLGVLATMWLQPNLLDVLAVYVILIASAPVLVPILLRYPFSFAAGSVALWWFAPILNPLVPNHRDGGLLFNPFGWQMLFYAGVAMGLFRQRFMPVLMPHAKLITIVAWAMFAFGATIVIASKFGEPALPLRNALKLVYGSIDKWPLDGTRFLAILAASWLVAVPLAGIMERLASTRAGVGLQQIGRGGLWSFIACVMLSVIGDAFQMNPPDQGFLRKLVVDLWAILALWWLAAIWLQWGAPWQKRGKQHLWAGSRAGPVSSTLPLGQLFGNRRGHGCNARATARRPPQEERTLLDLTTIRAELETHYDLQPSLELAESMSDIHARMERVVPLPDWAIAAPYVKAINDLKRERNAVVLAHNYMTPQIYHGISDVVGDSLALAIEATRVEADVIVQCGVHFMAETSKILNPAKTVLMPDMEAGCSLAESITAAGIAEMRAQYPGAPVVSYVNTTAEVKAASDICCTSANAAQIVAAMEGDTVIMTPDKYLAQNVAKQVPQKNIVWWDGRCIVHEKFTAQDLRDFRGWHPDLKIIAHPECPPDVLAEADFAGSTAGILDWVGRERPGQAMLVTECSMAANISDAHPEVEFLGPCNMCPYMKKITLEKVLWSLHTMTGAVEVAPDIADRARVAVQRMIDLSRQLAA